MSVDREHLGRHCYICREDVDKECTNLVHARLYSTAAGRGAEADWGSFNSTPDSNVAAMIEEMGFVECQTLCPAGKPHGCFHRPKQTSTRVGGIRNAMSRM